MPRQKQIQEELLHVGKSYQMLESAQIVSGKICYASDIQFPRMLHGKVLRSPHAHAKILSVDTSRAEKLPGVKAVITAEDFPPERFGTGIQDRHVLAREIVRYVGEPVAAVAAVNLEVAEKATELITVDYQPLPAVFDSEVAMGSNPPTIIHRDFERYSKRPTTSIEFGVRVPKGVPNICNYFTVRHGDVEKGFEEADFVVENRYENARAQQCPLEPHTAVARPEPDGGVTIWTASVLVYHLVRQMASTLKMPITKIRIIVPPVGGSYGAKNSMEVEPLCALLAIKTGRPVKIVLTRKEEFLTITRHPFVVYVKDGVKRDGRLVARKVKTVLNGGAYSGAGGYIVARNCCFGVLDVYKCPNISVDSYRVYTNLPPAGPFRGFGIPQVLWGIEQQMDIIAEMLKMDPVELRRRNLLKDGDVNGLGERMHNLPLGECLGRVAESIKWGEQTKSIGAWRIARGIAVGTKYSQAPTTANANARLLPDGNLEVFVTVVDSGQGIRTALAQIAAEELKIPIEKVTVSFPDTLYTPYDEGAVSSRSVYTTGNAVRVACQELKVRVLRAAARMLNENEELLELREGGITNRGTGESIPLERIFTQGFGDDNGEFATRGTWSVRASEMDVQTAQPVDLKPGDKEVRVNSFYTPISSGAEVAVNVETGEMRILKAVYAVDVGRAINRNIVLGQITGAATMALGVTLFEEMNFEDGRLLNSGFLDYKLPTVLDLPMDIEATILESNQVEGPYGAKGAGEVGIITIGPAVANAIYNAIGVRIKEAPLTPKKILDAMEGAKPQLAPTARKPTRRLS